MAIALPLTPVGVFPCGRKFRDKRRPREGGDVSDTSGAALQVAGCGRVSLCRRRGGSAWSTPSTTTVVTRHYGTFDWACEH